MEISNEKNPQLMTKKRQWHPEGDQDIRAEAGYSKKTSYTLGHCLR